MNDKNISLKKSKKVMKFDNDKYIIHFDNNNQYPTVVTRYNESWKNVIGDNLVYFLCAKIEELETELFKLNEEICNEYRCTDYIMED